MRLVVVAGLLAGCGRVGFDVAERTADAPLDDAMIDARLDAPAIAGIRVWLPFDDDPTDGVDNLASGGLASCVSSCPTVVPGLRSSAYQFNGSSDALIFPDNAGLHSPEGTVTVWVRLASLPAQDQYMVLASKVFGAGQENTWELFLHQGAMVTISGGGDAAMDDRYAQTEWTLGTNTWVHLAVTWGANVRLYIDGVLGPELGANGRTYDSGPVYIGGDFDNGSITGLVAGDLDELLIFSRELAAAEIAVLATP